MQLEDIKPGMRVEVQNGRDGWHSGTVSSISRQTRVEGERVIVFVKCDSGWTSTLRFPECAERIRPWAPAASLFDRLKEVLGPDWTTNRNPQVDDMVRYVADLKAHARKLAGLLNGPDGAHAQATAADTRCRAAEAKMGAIAAALGTPLHAHDETVLVDLIRAKCAECEMLKKGVDVQRARDERDEARRACKQLREERDLAANTYYEAARLARESQAAGQAMKIEAEKACERSAEIVASLTESNERLRKENDHFRERVKVYAGMRDILVTVREEITKQQADIFTGGLRDYMGAVDVAVRERVEQAGG